MHPIITIFMLLTLLYSNLWTFTQAQTTQGNNPTGNLLIEPTEFNFGLIDEGIEVTHDFKLTNLGKTNLLIYNAYATCGCTIPKLTKNKLKPHESTILKITVDTTMKRGKVDKKVFLITNDKIEPKSTINLLMTVKDPHKGLTREKMAKIFTSEKCTSCHVARGIGLFGRDLYNADCAMCHGPKAEGAVGPKLFGPYYDPVFTAKMTKTASFGSQTSITMPGFLSDANGPLNRDQIDSIIKYLSDLSKLRHYQ